MVITRTQLHLYTGILLMLLFAVLVIFPSAHAGAIADFPKYMLDTVNNGVSDVIISNLSSDDGNNKMYALVVSEGGSALITGVMNAVYSVSMFVVIIIAGMKYINELDRGADPKESMYKVLMQFFIAGFFLLNIKYILSAIVQIGEWFISSVGAAAETSPGLTLGQIVGSDDGGVIWWIESVVILLIPWILSLALQVFAKFSAFSILFELGIRKAFAPFAVADIYSEGMRSPGVRYLKKYLATFLKIAIALFSCHLGVELMQTVLPDASATSAFDTIAECFNYIFSVVAINLTVLGLLTKGGEYANDILGV